MDPPGDDEKRDENVLSPEELDISGLEEVAEIEDGRYVIGADEDSSPTEVVDATDVKRGGRNARQGDDSNTTEDATIASGPDRSRDTTQSREPPAISGRDVKRWITEELERTDSQYAYRIATKSGETIAHQQLASDDIGTAFDGLLLWFAQQIASGTPVEEALGILLAESNIRVRHPVSGMQAYLAEHDLDPEDSIGTLMATIRAEDGLEFPPPSRRR
ncbi:MAG: hypothetical protein ABEJ55_08240 [Halanaeroarchaeum sp.]